MGGVILDRALTLETPTRVSDQAGGFREDWTPLGTLYARVTPRTGNLAQGLERTISRVGYRITLRAAPPGAPSRPRAGQRLREGVRIFAILAVTDGKDGPLYLDCFAEEEVGA